MFCYIWTLSRMRAIVVFLKLFRFHLFIYYIFNKHDYDTPYHFHNTLAAAKHLNTSHQFQIYLFHTKKKMENLYRDDLNCVFALVIPSICKQRSNCRLSSNRFIYHFYLLSSFFCRCSFKHMFVCFAIYSSFSFDFIL